MTVEEILTLAKAGYTAQQIEAMGKPAEQTEPEVIEKPDDQSGSDAAEAENQPQSSPEVIAALNKANETNAKLLELLGKIQKDNVRGAEQNAPEKMTAESVIKNFIQSA